MDLNTDQGFHEKKLPKECKTGRVQKLRRIWSFAESREESVKGSSWGVSNTGYIKADENKSRSKLPAENSFSDVDGERFINLKENDIFVEEGYKIEVRGGRFKHDNNAVATSLTGGLSCDKDDSSKVQVSFKIPFSCTKMSSVYLKENDLYREEGYKIEVVRGDTECERSEKISKCEKNRDPKDNILDVKSDETVQRNGGANHGSFISVRNEYEDFGRKELSTHEKEGSKEDEEEMDKQGKSSLEGDSIKEIKGEVKSNNIENSTNDEVARRRKEVTDTDRYNEGSNKQIEKNLKMVKTNEKRNSQKEQRNKRYRNEKDESKDRNKIFYHLGKEVSSIENKNVTLERMTVPYDNEIYKKCKCKSEESKFGNETDENEKLLKKESVKDVHLLIRKFEDIDKENIIDKQENTVNRSKEKKADEKLSNTDKILNYGEDMNDKFNACVLCSKCNGNTDIFENEGYIKDNDKNYGKYELDDISNTVDESNFSYYEGKNIKNDNNSNYKEDVDKKDEILKNFELENDNVNSEEKERKKSDDKKARNKELKSKKNKNIIDTKEGDGDEKTMNANLIDDMVYCKYRCKANEYAEKANNCCDDTYDVIQNSKDIDDYIYKNNKNNQNNDNNNINKYNYDSNSDSINNDKNGVNDDSTIEDNDYGHQVVKKSENSYSDVLGDNYLKNDNNSCNNAIDKEIEADKSLLFDPIDKIKKDNEDVEKKLEYKGVIVSSLNRCGNNKVCESCSANKGKEAKEDTKSDIYLKDKMAKSDHEKEEKNDTRVKNHSLEPEEVLDGKRAINKDYHSFHRKNENEYHKVEVKTELEKNDMRPEAVIEEGDKKATIIEDRKKRNNDEKDNVSGNSRKKRNCIKCFCQKNAYSKDQHIIDKNRSESCKNISSDEGEENVKKDNDKLSNVYSINDNGINIIRTNESRMQGDQLSNETMRKENNGSDAIKDLENSSRERRDNTHEKLRIKHENKSNYALETEFEKPVTNKKKKEFHKDIHKDNGEDNSTNAKKISEDDEDKENKANDKFKKKVCLQYYSERDVCSDDESKDKKQEMGKTKESRSNENGLNDDDINSNTVSEKYIDSDSAYDETNVNYAEVANYSVKEENTKRREKKQEENGENLKEVEKNGYSYKKYGRSDKKEASTKAKSICIRCLWENDASSDESAEEKNKEVKRDKNISSYKNEENHKSIKNEAKGDVIAVEDINEIIDIDTTFYYDANGNRFDKRNLMSQTICRNCNLEIKTNEAEPQKFVIKEAEVTINDIERVEDNQYGFKTVDEREENKDNTNENIRTPNKERRTSYETEDLSRYESEYIQSGQDTEKYTGVEQTNTNEVRDKKNGQNNDQSTNSRDRINFENNTAKLEEKDKTNYALSDKKKNNLSKNNQEKVKCSIEKATNEEMKNDGNSLGNKYDVNDTNEEDRSGSNEDEVNHKDNIYLEANNFDKELQRNTSRKQEICANCNCTMNAAGEVNNNLNEIDEVNDDTNKECNKKLENEIDLDKNDEEDIESTTEKEANNQINSNGNQSVNRYVVDDKTKDDESSSNAINENDFTEEDIKADYGEKRSEESKSRKQEMCTSCNCTLNAAGEVDETFEEIDGVKRDAISKGNNNLKNGFDHDKNNEEDGENTSENEANEQIDSDGNSSVNRYAVDDKTKDDESRSNVMDENGFTEEDIKADYGEKRSDESYSRKQEISTSCNRTMNAAGEVNNKLKEIDEVNDDTYKECNKKLENEIDLDKNNEDDIESTTEKEANNQINSNGNQSVNRYVVDDKTKDDESSSNAINENDFTEEDIKADYGEKRSEESKSRKQEMCTSCNCTLNAAGEVDDAFEEIDGVKRDAISEGNNNLKNGFDIDKNNEEDGENTSEKEANEQIDSDGNSSVDRYVVNDKTKDDESRSNVMDENDITEEVIKAEYGEKRSDESYSRKQEISTSCNCTMNAAGELNNKLKEIDEVNDDTNKECNKKLENEIDLDKNNEEDIESTTEKEANNQINSDGNQSVNRYVVDDKTKDDESSSNAINENDFTEEDIKADYGEKRSEESKSRKQEMCTSCNCTMNAFKEVDDTFEEMDEVKDNAIREGSSILKNEIDLDENNQEDADICTDKEANEETNGERNSSTSIHDVNDKTKEDTKFFNANDRYHIGEKDPKADDRDDKTKRNKSRYEGMCTECSYVFDVFKKKESGLEGGKDDRNSTGEKRGETTKNIDNELDHIRNNQEEVDSSTETESKKAINENESFGNNMYVVNDKTKENISSSDKGTKNHIEVNHLIVYECNKEEQKNMSRNQGMCTNSSCTFEVVENMICISKEKNKLNNITSGKIKDGNEKSKNKYDLKKNDQEEEVSSTEREDESSSKAMDENNIEEKDLKADKRSQKGESRKHGVCVKCSCTYGVLEITESTSEEIDKVEGDTCSKIRGGNGILKNEFDLKKESNQEDTDSSTAEKANEQIDDYGISSAKRYDVNNETKEEKFDSNAMDRIGIKMKDVKADYDEKRSEESNSRKQEISTSCNCIMNAVGEEDGTSEKTDEVKDNASREGNNNLKKEIDLKLNIQEDVESTSDKEANEQINSGYTSVNRYVVNDETREHESSSNVMDENDITTEKEANNQINSNGNQSVNRYVVDDKTKDDESSSNAINENDFTEEDIKADYGEKRSEESKSRKQEMCTSCNCTLNAAGEVDDAFEEIDGVKHDAISEGINNLKNGFDLDKNNEEDGENTSEKEANEKMNSDGNSSVNRYVVNDKTKKDKSSPNAINENDFTEEDIKADYGEKRSEESKSRKQEMCTSCNCILIAVGEVDGTFEEIDDVKDDAIIEKNNNLKNEIDLDKNNQDDLDSCTEKEENEQIDVDGNSLAGIHDMINTSKEDTSRTDENYIEEKKSRFSNGNKNIEKDELSNQKKATSKDASQLDGNNNVVESNECENRVVSCNPTDEILEDIQDENACKIYNDNRSEYDTLVEKSDDVDKEFNTPKPTKSNKGWICKKCR